MKFSICISTIRPDTLGAAITSIHRQTWKEWELIVVGQGKDPTLRQIVEAASQEDPRIRYVHLHQRGLSRGRNAALQSATGEITAFMDDDCEAHADWLAVLAECFDRELDVGLIGGALIPPQPLQRGIASCPGSIPAEALYDPSTHPCEPPPGWDWIGGNFAMRRQLIEQCGLFDECLGAGSDFPAAEDTDYKLRLEKLGVKMRSTPRSVVYHTYGFRYGLRAAVQLSRNYAYGNGGLAGKLTLLNDPRGLEWKHNTWRDCLRKWRHPLRPHRIAVDLLRLKNYITAYNHCIRTYEINNGLLCPKNL